MIILFDGWNSADCDPKYIYATYEVTQQRFDGLRWKFKITLLMWDHNNLNKRKELFKLFGSIYLIIIFIVFCYKCLKYVTFFIKYVFYSKL